MKTKMSISKALKLASKHVVIFRWNATSYQVIMPHDSNCLSGPTTSIQRSDYFSAVRVAGECKAELACTILGLPVDQAREAGYEVYSTGKNWREVVRDYARVFKNVGGE